MNQITVASLNIHHGANQAGEFNIEKLIQFLQNHPSDVICLNEVDQYWSDRSRNLDLPQILSSQITQHSYFAPSIVKNATHRYGNMLLSNQPLLNQYSHLISDPTINYKGNRFTEPRTCLSAQITNGNHAITIIGTHIGFGEEQQRYQVNKILELCYQGKPTILVGDFNAKINDASLDLLKSSLTSYTSFDGIDHIFASHHFELTASEQVQNDVSDHPLVLATFKMVGEQHKI